MSKTPLLTFGLVSDVQYADHDNKKSFHGQTRHYRKALLCLKEVTCFCILPTFLFHFPLPFIQGD
jgi:hypothetical protein